MKAYPSIFLLKNDRFYKYKGDRSKESFLWFAKEGYNLAELQGPVPVKVVSPEGDSATDEKRRNSTMFERLGHAAEISFDIIGLGTYVPKSV